MPTTGIGEAAPLNDKGEMINDKGETINDKAGECYSLDGRKMSAKPTKKGVYINDGKKVVVKN